MASNTPPSIQDFELSYKPQMSNVYPHSQPQIAPSAELFSASETTDLLGFLDNFNDVNWDYQNEQTYPRSQPQLPPVSPYFGSHLSSMPQLSPASRPRPTPRSSSHRTPYNRPLETSESSVSPNPSFSETNADSRPRPLLSTPQKRLNHIMSEQKRRNAIRDGYAQLISLLAPAGAPTIDMPTRGRPKGSGSHAKGQTKGKSGVLFRAVEYCRWLEEGKDALHAEVLRLEAAAGIHH